MSRPSNGLSDPAAKDRGSAKRPSALLLDTGRRPASRWDIVAAGALPGVLGGAHLAGLLFFLNPHLPFSAATVTRAVLYYAFLLGLVSLALHLPLTWRSRQRARRLLPWSLILVLTGTGIGAFVHASRFAFFLPPGMNLRLVKLGVLVTASAMVSFYTALIHRIQRRPYGRGSRILLAGLALLSVYAAFERRDAFRPRRGSTPRATLIESKTRPNLVVVGVDTATLDAILPLAEVERLPFFSRMRNEGAYARLSSLRPSLRGALWAAIATGTFPYKHRFLGETEYRAPFADEGLRLLPLGIGFDTWGTRGIRDVQDEKAIHRLTLPRILGRLGLKVATVGWPGETPPAPEMSILLPEGFFSGREGPESQVTPDDLEERARLFEPSGEEVDLGVISRFGADPPDSVIKSLRSDLWRAGLSRFLLEQDPAIDALFLVLPGLENVSLLHFGGHGAVQFHGAQSERETRSAQLIGAYYEALDSTLADLWEMIPEPKMMTIVSSYGIEEPSRRRRLLGRVIGQPALHGLTKTGPDGLIMMLGEGIRAEMISGPISLVDVAPTLLYGLGFPVANDMDGIVLTRAFDPIFLTRHALSFVPSYETLAER